MVKTDFEKYGIDYADGIKRCMNDESFYFNFLTMFLSDDCYPRAKAAYENKDYKTLFECVHELKGVCGNTGIKNLYDICSKLVESLRNGFKSEPEIVDLFSKLTEAYNLAIEGISQLKAEN